MIMRQVITTIMADKEVCAVLEVVDGISDPSKSRTASSSSARSNFFYWEAQQTASIKVNVNI